MIKGTEQQKNTPSEEIDLGQILTALGNGLKRVIKGFFMALDFCRRKIYVLLGLAVLGLALAYVYDYVIKQNPETYEQEFIVEPNFNSAGYTYNVIEGINNQLGDPKAINEGFGLTKKEMSLLKSVELSPIINLTELIFSMKDDAREAILDKMTTMDDRELMEPPFREIFKKHKLRFVLANNLPEAAEIPKKVIAFIDENNYFKNIGETVIKNVKNNIERNDKSVEFIDDYLDDLRKESNAQVQSGAEITLFNEKDAPDVAAVLEQKNSLLKERESMEIHVNVHNETLKVIDARPLKKESKSLIENNLLLFPLFLTAGYLLAALLLFLHRKMRSYVL